MCHIKNKFYNQKKKSSNKPRQNILIKKRGIVPVQKEIEEFVYVL